MPLPSDHEVGRFLGTLLNSDKVVSKGSSPSAVLPAPMPSYIKILRNAFYTGLILLMFVVFLTQAPGLVTSFFHAFPAAFPTPAP